jgi:O-antigen biosynthesis protein
MSGVKAAPPFVSVVVLNYNGLRFLDGCLGSLACLDYPTDRYEVVLVDNVSKDGSVEVAEKRFPNVRVVRNSRNLGFAGGNNVAMRGTASSYVVLLNNDTSVDPQWLSRLVEAAEQDPAIGACTSKLLFQHDRARVILESTAFRPSDQGSTDQRELGIQVRGARCHQDGESRDAEYLNGFFGWEPSPNGQFRWSAPAAILGLRVRRDGAPASLRLVASAPRPEGGSVVVTAHSGETVLGSWELGAEPQEIDVPLPENLVRSATAVIQNVGTLILHDGSGRDRGASVRGTEVFQEDDLGQYSQREEVFAGCGAALLFRTSMLEDVGIFDDDFFMYYEDMDLSWRMRRRGWKVMYVPDAVVRHVHAASSVEWSPLFLFHVERNRLLMLGKNAPIGLALSEHARYTASLVLNLGRFVRSVLLRSPDLAAVGARTRIQIRVMASLLRLLPSTMAKRRSLARSEVVQSAKLLDWMVAG